MLTLTAGKIQISQQSIEESGLLHLNPVRHRCQKELPGLFLKHLLPSVPSSFEVNFFLLPLLLSLLNYKCPCVLKILHQPQYSSTTFFCGLQPCETQVFKAILPPWMSRYPFTMYPPKRKNILHSTWRNKVGLCQCCSICPLHIIHNRKIFHGPRSDLGKSVHLINVELHCKIRVISWIVWICWNTQLRSGSYKDLH